ncbi:hypothetical protein E4T56_gene3722 [Termitomyces sp. T112]|nr:hypothetical protein E4T56_gene3722 [Termitomyces sp. T112]
MHLTRCQATESGLDQARTVAAWFHSRLRVVCKFELRHPLELLLYSQCIRWFFSRLSRGKGIIELAEEDLFSKLAHGKLGGQVHVHGTR